MRSDLPPVGQRLGDFEICREIGRGGMGVVYEARQLSLNRKVALKVLSSSLGLTPKAVQRFQREAEAAARLHHTNIVPVYATGEQEGTHFYAMELVEGSSLDKVIRQLREAQDAKPPAESPSSANDEAATGSYVEGSSTSTSDAATLTSSSLGSDSHYFDTVAKMIADVAEALDYAHHQGVIHRDIKPSNLLLAPDGRLSINDFGLARMLEQPGMTMTGEFVGTPAYMSPEQITAGRVPVDQRTDIYSLGATLYELLAWQPPFRGERRDQVLAQIIHKEPKPPRKLNRKVPVDLETICLKAMDKDPDRRYQTAAVFAEDLRRFVNRFAISARRAGPVQRLAKAMRRHPGLAAGLVCALAAVSVASFFAYQAHVLEQRRLGEQQEHKRELLASNRQHATDKALLAAMSGDLDGAEREIREAELLGASAAQVRTLRGQVAYFHGEVEAAIQHLEQAVKLHPKSVAAWGMLASAYNYAGQYERYVEIVELLDRLSPLTPQDYLFEGFAQSWNDPVRGLQTMDEAIRRRDAPLARVLRGEARALYALDTAEPADAELAVQDANLAKGLLPDNSYALSVSLWAHLAAAGAYEEVRQPEKRQSALGQADLDARALERFPANRNGVWLRSVYFLSVGQEEAALEALRRCSEQTRDHNIALSYAVVLCQRGDFENALQVLDGREQGSDLGGDVTRAYILAELPDGPALALEAYKDLTARYPGGPGPLAAQTVLLLVGRKPEAVAACLEFRKQAERFPVLMRRDLERHRLDYNCDLLSADGWLKAAETSKVEQCVAHYHIALRKLSEGDRLGAREHFQKCLETRFFATWAYDWSRMFLARMEQDPVWPPWIPVKEDDKDLKR